MGNTKREERRARSEAARTERERLQKQRRLQRPMIIAVGLLVLIAVAVMATQRRSSGGGRVWSAEHGHWHDR
jgi:hypothetical protein